MLAWQMSECGSLTSETGSVQAGYMAGEINKSSESVLVREPEICWRKCSAPGSGGKVSRGWFLSVPMSGGGRAAARRVLCCWGSSCTETHHPKLEISEEPAALANPVVMGQEEGNGRAEAFCVFRGTEPRWSGHFSAPSGAWLMMQLLAHIKSFKRT